MLETRQIYTKKTKRIKKIFGPENKQDSKEIGDALHLMQKYFISKKVNITKSENNLEF